VLTTTAEPLNIELTIIQTQRNLYLCIINISCREIILSPTPTYRSDARSTIRQAQPKPYTSHGRALYKVQLILFLLLKIFEIQIPIQILITPEVYLNYPTFSISQTETTKIFVDNNISLLNQDRTVVAIVSGLRYCDKNENIRVFRFYPFTSCKYDCFFDH